MIPNAKLRVVETHGVESDGASVSGTFGISLKDSAHIMTILRDTLYSDKILAVIREYSSNAWDSHRESGIPDVPIKVTLPTTMDPTLSIRDFGAGLSRDDVFKIYPQYGYSTKRNSDASVGMLGIGSKSGFAYSDSFIIVSYHGGMKRTFIAVLDKSEKGEINLLHEEPCGEETGVLIKMAVRPEDINEFTQKGKHLYQYFKPVPDINIELPKLSPAQMALTQGVIYSNGDDRTGWVAVMGCVAYRINLDQLKSFGTTEGVAEFLSGISGALYFNIGEVEINASREELKYSPETKEILIRKFNLLVDEYVSNTLKDIESGNFTPWERRVKAQVLNELLLPVPENSKDLVSGSVPTKGKIPDTIFIFQNKVASTSIKVEKDSRFILRDDRRNPRGFNLTTRDYMVKPMGKANWDKVLEDLNKAIEAMGLVGIPVVKLSTMPWSTPRRGNGGALFNEKHRLKTFQLKESNHRPYFDHPYSRYWDSVDRWPTKDDVFVIINNFKGTGWNFYSAYQEDVALAKAFGGKMPTVFGYKSTTKHQVVKQDVTGIEYQEWRKTFVKSLLTPEVLELLDNHQWSEVIDDPYSYRSKITPESIRKLLVKELDKDHLILQFVERNIAARKALNQNKGPESREREALLERAEEFLGNSVTGMKAARAIIIDRYPMLALPGITMSVLGSEHADKWLHYIKLIDGTP